MPSYRVMLDVPRDLIWFVSGLLAARRRSIGTRKKTRSLGCYRQAVFGLAWFRDKGSIPRLGAGFGLSQATSYRYLDEVIDVLAERAPGLRDALAGLPQLVGIFRLTVTVFAGQVDEKAPGTRNGVGTRLSACRLR